MVTYNTTDDLYGVAALIVDSTAGSGNYTTIASALTAATSGQTIFIRPGTYTENLTLKAGVNLTAFGSDCSLNGTGVVIINGTCTMTTAGSVTISGIQLQTNSAAAIAVTGSAASIVNINSCFLNFTNNTGITFSSSSSSALIYINNCKGDLGTTGIAYFSHSSSGTLKIFYCELNNSGASTTANTVSAGAFTLQFSTVSIPITYSSSDTANSSIVNSGVNNIATNTTSLTTSGTGSFSITNSNIQSGTASAVSIGVNTTVSMRNAVVFSSNTNAITGAGTLSHNLISFTSTSSTINTTTQSPLYSQLGKYKASGQPAFLAYLNTTVNNITGDNTNYTVIYDTEVFDQGNDFNLGTSTFTAPVTGRYHIDFSGSLIGGTSMSGITCTAATTNHTYRITMPLNAGVTTAASAVGSTLADMTAGDTLTIGLLSTDSGGKIDDAAGTTSSQLRNWVSCQLLA